MSLKTIVRYSASGSTDTFNVPFPYLDESHVHVLVGGVEVSASNLSWPSAATIEITTGNPAAGSVVEVRRQTPTGGLVTFAPGNLDTTDLNVAVTQARFIAEEALDIGNDLVDRGWTTSANGGGGVITIGPTGSVPQWDAGGNLSGNIPLGTIEEASTNAAQTASDRVQTGLDAAAAQAARDAALGAVPNVFSPTRTALKALNTSTTISAYLLEPSREGQFQFRTGDYSAQITTDTAEGVYIKADDTAANIGALVRLYQGAASVKWFGAKGDGTTDDSAAIQAAEDFFDGQGRKLLFPAGIYAHASTLTKRNAVDWQGDGKNVSSLKYTGDVLAIDAKGTSTDRRIFCIRDMSITSDSYLNNADAVELDWNMRSLPIMERVGINTFGGYAIKFMDQNWLVYFQGIEIHDCARGVAGASALWRNPDSAGIADIKFFDSVIEACGTPGTTAGAVLWVANSPYSTQGLWFIGCDIEGNFGGSDAYFEGVDLLGLTDTYMEISIPAQWATATNYIVGQQVINDDDANGAYNTYTCLVAHTAGTFASDLSSAYWDDTGAAARNAIRAVRCNISLKGGRLSSDAHNSSGRAVLASQDVNISVEGTGFDSDFGGADIDLHSNSWLHGGNAFQYSLSPLRVVKDDTSGLIGGAMQVAAWGRFDGTTGTRQAGENFASVTRNSAGDYTVVFVKAMPDANYIVTVAAESGSYLTMAAGPKNINSASSFGIQVTDVAGAAGVATDGRQVSFQVLAQMG